MATHFLLHYGPWEDMVHVILILNNHQYLCPNFFPDKNSVCTKFIFSPGDRPPSPAGQQAGLPAEDGGGGHHQDQAGPRLPVQKTCHPACSQASTGYWSSKSANLIPTMNLKVRAWQPHGPLRHC